MFETIRILILCIFGLLGLFVVCLALPHSKLRDVVMQILGYGVAAGAAVYAISPLDVIPDFIPVLGWVDDVGAIVVAIAGIMAAGNAAKAQAQQQLD